MLQFKSLDHQLWIHCSVQTVEYSISNFNWKRCEFDTNILCARVQESSGTYNYDRLLCDQHRWPRFCYWRVGRCFAFWHNLTHYIQIYRVLIRWYVECWSVLDLPYWNFNVIVSWSTMLHKSEVPKRLLNWLLADQCLWNQFHAATLRLIHHTPINRLLK